MSTKLTISLFALCDYASIDRDGKLNIMGIFREIFVEKMPVQLLRFYLAAVVAGEPEKTYDVNIYIKSPDGSLTIPKQESTIQIGVGGITNIVTDVINLPLTQTGQYTISLTTNDNQELGSGSFRILSLNKQAVSN